LKQLAQCELLRSAAANSLVEIALVMPFLMAVLFGVVDFGRMYFMAMEVAGAAEAGALYGVSNHSDTAGMKSAATLSAPDVPGLTVPTPTYGCECSNGSNYSASCTSTPTCTSNVVYRVTVTVSATYTPFFPWPSIPASIPLSNTVVMRTSN
jgi:Flp pilus assembly protein TadG